MVRGSYRSRVDIPSRGWPPIALDVKEYPFTAFDQLERASRAINRFRGFVNAPATPELECIMRDEFFEAAECVWHVKDHIGSDLEVLSSDPKCKAEAQAGRNAMTAAQNTPPMQALRSIANASKHLKLRKPETYPGKIILRLDGDIPATRGGFYMADIYARYRLRLGDDETHPTDFLEARLRTWYTLANEHLRLLLGNRWLERMLGPP